MILRLALAAAMTAAASAHGGTVWNRKAEAITMVPGPDADDPWQVVFYFSIDAIDLQDPMDLSSTAEVRVNGAAQHVEVFGTTAMPVEGVECGGQPCLTGSCFCSDGECTCGPLVLQTIAHLQLDPGDVVTGTVMPAAGAVPDNNGGDDTHLVDFTGESLYWNQSVDIIDVDPAPGGGFDIRVDFTVDSNYEGLLDLSTFVDVRIGGVTQAGLVLGLNDQEFQLCGGSCFLCWAFGSCSGGDDCACSGVIELSFNAVPGEPGETLDVVLVPGSGALPAMPGTTDDDAASGWLCPWDCGEADGVVGVVDFLALIGQWGEQGSSCDLGLGTDGVGVHEFLDFIANWGGC